MDKARTIKRMEGCFVAVPTYFHEDLSLNLDARRKHTKFLIDGGLREGNACLLTTGASGDFTTLTVDERLEVAEAVLEETQGRVGLIVGAQSCNQAESIEIAQGAARLGADAVQISPPYYHPHTPRDVYEYVKAVGESADIGLVVYPTFWTATPLTEDEIEQMIDDVPNIVSIKYAARYALQFMSGTRRFSKKVCVGDNQLCTIDAYLAGARSFNIHICNFWPQWGINLMKLLDEAQYTEAYERVMDVLLPWYEFYWHAKTITGGEGHLDKIATELLGFETSRCRPPTRDIREEFRPKMRAYMERIGVPKPEGVAQPA